MRWLLKFFLCLKYWCWETTTRVFIIITADAEISPVLLVNGLSTDWLFTLVSVQLELNGTISEKRDQLRPLASQLPFRMSFTQRIKSVANKGSALLSNSPFYYERYYEDTSYTFLCKSPSHKHETINNISHCISMSIISFSSWLVLAFQRIPVKAITMNFLNDLLI